jgi:hypothetical protein
VKAASIGYFCLTVLLGTMLVGCQANLVPSSAPNIAYEIVARDGNSGGIVHIVSSDETQVEWDAWLDWHDGGLSKRSVFHAVIKLNEAGAIVEANISRHPDEILHLTVVPDKLHCELTEGNQPVRSFDIITNGAALFIPPLPFPSDAESILCFDPFSWDYFVARTSPDSMDAIGVFAGDKKVGTIKTDGDGMDAWELPLTAMALGKRIEFNAESVPAAAVIPPTLSVQDMACLSALVAEFELTLPRTATWNWAGAGDFVYDVNTCKGEWIFSNKGTPVQPAGKNRSAEEAGWSIGPAQLAAIQPPPGLSPRAHAIPSSPLSALVRGMGDDRSRAWLAGTLAQEQGWQARIAGGIVLRPGRDYMPVLTQWAEVLRNGATEIMDADVAAGFHLRLWTAPEPLADIDSKVAIKTVQVASPSSWHIVPPAAGKQAWQWEFSRDGAKLGQMVMTWQMNLTSSRPTITITYQGDSMNLPVAGNITLEVDAGGHVWGYLSPDSAKSPWLLLALFKGWMLCPVGNDTIASLALYFTSRDENGWLPPLLWTDGQPAEVREAGEATYSDGKELRSVKRYRVDPPGLLVSVAEGGELLEVKGEFGVWHRVNLATKKPTFPIYNQY